MLKKFIVFEGLDGAGTETQSNLLFDYLKKNKRKVEKFSYPDYHQPIGHLIHLYLHQKYEFSPETQFFLYFLDFVKDIRKINKFLKEKRIIISDRYFSSTLVYQGVKGFPLGKALKIAKIVNLPKPDLIIYLKISPETSLKRKIKEKKILDRHEIDTRFLKKVSRFYDGLIKNNFFSNWVVIDGEKKIEDVFKEVKKVLKI